MADETGGGAPVPSPAAEVAPTNGNGAVKVKEATVRWATWLAIAGVGVLGVCSFFAKPQYETGLVQCLQILGSVISAGLATKASLASPGNGGGH